MVGPTLTALLATLLLWPVAANADDGAPEPPELRIGELENCSAGDQVLTPCPIGYRLAGRPLGSGAPIMLFPTWYTGTTAELWEAGYVGPGAIADTDHYTVILVDALANGVSASPANHPQGAPAFATLTIGDMVKSQYQLLRETLAIDQLDVVLGVSMGGMQALDWAVRYPDFMHTVVAIEGTPWPTAWDQLNWDGMLDTMASFDGSEPSRAQVSRRLARQEAQVLWSPDYFVSMVGERDAQQWLADFDGGRSASDIINHQAQLRASRRHDVGRLVGDSRTQAARRVQARLLVAVYAQDHYVHPAPSQVFAEVAGGERWLSPSSCGHMAPNAECEQSRLRDRIHDFLQVQH